MSDVEVKPGVFTLLCDMDEACLREVTHIDSNGFIYCTDHGIQRRGWQPCRKLRSHEVNGLKRGKPVSSY